MLNLIKIYNCKVNNDLILGWYYIDNKIFQIRNRSFNNVSN